MSISVGELKPLDRAGWGPLMISGTTCSADLFGTDFEYLTITDKDGKKIQTVAVMVRNLTRSPES